MTGRSASPYLAPGERARLVVRPKLLAVVVGFVAGPLAEAKCHGVAPIGYLGRIGEASNPGPTGPVFFNRDNPEADVVSEAENDFLGAEHFHIGSCDSDHEMSGGDVQAVC